MVYNMDLSSNKLVGKTLVELTTLIKLVGLNLSNNHLSGGIPHKNGNMMKLESLNLSRNKLTGMIPRRNRDPYGPPLTNNSSKLGEGPTPTIRSKKKYRAANEKMKVWLFYVYTICGFAIGFWGVIWVLLFKKQCRQKLFMFAEKTMDNIYVAVLIRVNKIKRGRQAS
ncbi:unnamed protein product [Lactuca saligna]|uniref:Non-specific serine/threonine protein kinase n=1 Tax=Lactuca saligna TaxID=75948 RepID=A0AA35ZXT8_LACSI|nr:unnamed protein product [Lactuca saligna]